MKKFSQTLFMALLLATVVQAVSAETRYRVKSSDNLNGIVERFYDSSDLSKGQLMVGVLAKNPKAFRGGNINFLLRGKRLTLPDESEIAQISPEIASQLLSQHARFFRIGITGDLEAPTLDELSMEPDVSRVGSVVKDMVLRQNQTKKIDQLQQESNVLKKQLEELLNAKTDRDNRLLELEKTLKQTLETAKKGAAKQATSVGDPKELSEKENELETANKLLQQKLQETKSELAENTHSNIVLERKVKNLKKEARVAETKIGESFVTPAIKDIKSNPTPDTKPSTGSSWAKLLWLLPLILLAGFFFHLFGKKKNIVDPADDTIANYEAEYLEANKDIDPEFEEEDLETSIKLDVARAYIEAEDTPSALDILTEIMEEGSDEQRQQAHELLEKISPS
ncbi:MAG: hypothetical protein L3J51_06170 [Cocleimonas sp.]|nr:hypothetical protein [Cocleimonas sp.]